MTLKTAWVVLGMHRSGTSALSRALSFHGAAQAQDLMAPQADNPKGFWESRGAVRLNNTILESLGGSWDRPGPWLLPRQGLEESRRALGRTIADHWHAAAASVLRTSFGAASTIVLKDPRICLFRPLWRQALDELGYRQRYVLIYRNPLEVAASLRERNALPQGQALQLWLHYTLAGLEEGEGIDSVVAYGELLEDPAGTLETIVAGQAAGAALAERARADLCEFISAVDRHHSIAPAAIERSPQLALQTKKAWRLLRNWSKMEAGARHAAVVELWNQYDEAAMAAGIWRAPDRKIALPAASAGAAREKARPAGIPKPKAAVPPPPVAAAQPEPKPPLILHYHLFKNAGSSVDAMLKSNFGARWEEKEFESRSNRTNVELVQAYLRDHPELAAFSSHTAQLPLPDIGREVFPVFFLRHPLARLLSAYKFERKQKAETFGAKLARSTDFAGYIEELLRMRNHRQARNFQTYRLSFCEPAAAGTEFERARRALDVLPFVGLVEAYDQSLERLQALLSPRLPEFKAVSVRKNATSAESETLEDALAKVEEGLGTELYGRVLEANADDVKLFELLRMRYRDAGTPPALERAEAAR